MASVSTGVLGQGCSYLAVGDGPPLVQVLSLTPTHEALAGMERRMALSNASPFSNHYRVYVVKLKKGLQPGESMSDIARHVATAIEDDIGEPVLLTGTSTSLPLGSYLLPRMLASVGAGPSAGRPSSCICDAHATASSRSGRATTVARPSMEREHLPQGVRFRHWDLRGHAAGQAPPGSESVTLAYRLVAGLMGGRTRRCRRYQRCP